MTIINLPGIGNSGELHWQTLWEQSGLVQQRFQPGCWDEPQLHDWVSALDEVISACAEPPLLVAHSLSCLLVAVPDTASAAFPAAAASFMAVPSCPLPFPALIVASDDDPYASISYARQRARQWRAGMVEVGACGHLNAASGLVDWYQGQALLTAFMAGLGQAA